MASTLILFKVKGPPIAHGEPRGIWLKDGDPVGLEPEAGAFQLKIDTVSTGDHRCLWSLSAGKSFFAFVLYCLKGFFRRQLGARHDKLSF